MFLALCVTEEACKENTPLICSGHKYKFLRQYSFGYPISAGNFILSDSRSKCRSTKSSSVRPSLDPIFYPSGAVGGRVAAGVLALRQ